MSVSLMTQHNTTHNSSTTTLTTSLEILNEQVETTSMFTYRHMHENVNIEMSLQVSYERQSNRFSKMWKNGAFGWGYLRPIRVF